MNPELHQRQRVQAGANIIEHNPPAAGQFFQQPQRRRFENIESSKKYKTGKSILPSHGNRNKGDPLAGNFVNDDEIGIALASFASGYAGNRNTPHRENECSHGETYPRLTRMKPECQPPQQNRAGRGPSTRPGLRKPVPNHVASTRQNQRASRWGFSSGSLGLVPALVTNRILLWLRAGFPALQDQ